VAHRLEVDEPEAFTAAGHREHGRALIEGLEALGRDEPGERHGRADAERGRARAQALDVITRSDEDELRVGNAGDHAGPGFDQLVMALIALVAQHPRHEHHRVRADAGQVALDWRADGRTAGRQRERAHGNGADAGVHLPHALGGEVRIGHAQRGTVEHAAHARGQMPPRFDAVEKDAVRAPDRRGHELLHARHGQVAVEHPGAMPDHLRAGELGAEPHAGRRR